MSTGPRIPLAWARGAADCLMRCWGMSTDECMIVGSVRRCRETVGDLEICAPLPAPGEPDMLYDAIAGTMETEGLFGAGTVPVGKPIQGFRRGFKAADIQADVTAELDGRPVPISLKVSIYRHTPENRGWTLIKCTGPAEFGQWFLGTWKRQHGIPTGDEAHRASIDGHLVDAAGNVVPVRDEHEAFRLAGLAWIDPRARAAVLEHRKTARPQALRD